MSLTFACDCLRPLKGSFTAMANAWLLVSMMAHNVDLLVVTAVVIVSQLVHLNGCHVCSWHTKQLVEARLCRASLSFAAGVDGLQT